MTTHRYLGFTIRRATAVLLGAAAIGATGIPAAAASGPLPIVVNVDAHAGLGIVPATGLGVNDAVWDSELGSRATSRLLRDAGVQTIRYPGGSYADMYHWQDNSVPGGDVAPNTDFDTFMSSVRKVGAQPIIIANYGTGSAAEAAGWVLYANRTKHYGVKYWEIGNEIYGNGHYGASWEADDHADKSPSAYADGVVQYAAAMKAADPSIKIGAVLTTPGNWPDGIVADGDTGTWNQIVLSIAGPSIDFVVLHWYPGGSSTADALSKPAQATDIAEMIRAQIVQYAGARSGQIGIALTEINSGAGVNTQPGALFAADVYPALWAGGMFTVSWWDVHNGIDTVSTLAGQTDYGDSGLLSNASCLADGTACEPPVNTPFAPYYALQLLHIFADPGNQLVRVTTSSPLVHGHAVRRRDGGLSVMLLNEDPQNAQQVALSYPGFIPVWRRPTLYTYLNGATRITRSHASRATALTLPAYSLTTLVLEPFVRLPWPPAPGTPVVSDVTDSAATITWQAARRGLLPPAGYEVYVQDANESHLAGHTTDTTLTLTGLELGTRYTVTVVAKDVLGLASWSSAAVPFVTATPATSTCAVQLTNTTDWGNGYVGSLDITNTGSEPIEGWTLEFAFPRPWESFSDGWNATWTDDGESVSAANVDWNATIAPGASINIGYVGNYAGPNVLPHVFTLNGTVCASSVWTARE
jgi:hypothetical protein